MNLRPPATRHDDASEDLQDCLERIEAGADPQSVLADCTIDMAGRLAPLLFAAEAVKRHRARPSDDFRRRTGLVLARVDAPRPILLSRFGMSPHVRILRLAATAVAIVLALGGLTVAQASRNPEGWAWRTLARAWTAARVLPGLWGAPAVGMQMDGPTPPRQLPSSDDQRPLVMAPERHETVDGGAYQPDPPAAATPGVALGRKPRSPAAAGAPGPSATPLLSAYAVATVAGSPPLSTVALPDGATPVAERPRPTAAAASTATVPIGNPPSAVAPPARSAGASIGGRVTLRGGRPLPGIPVIVFRHDAEGNARWWDAVATARTDADGRYQLQNLPPDSYKVMAGYPFFFAPRRWYPSAARSTDGQAVVLAAGQERGDIDLSFGEEMVAPLLLWAHLGR